MKIFLRGPLVVEPRLTAEYHARAMDKAKLAQDFLFELMKDTHRLRARCLAERERWVRGLKVPGREEILFELEMLLRGLDRFFNLRRIPGAHTPARDFRPELRVVRDALHRAILISRKLIPAEQERALVFRSYVEASLADDQARVRSARELLEQKNPEESLFLLRSGLVAHEAVIDGLLRLDDIPQALFLNAGRLLWRTVADSKYFRPPGALEPRAEYDRLQNLKLIEVLRSIPEDRSRRALELPLLSALRMLRTLRYVPAPGLPQPRRSMLVLSLVRSELGSLATYLEHDLPRLWHDRPTGPSPAPGTGPDLKAAARRSAARLEEALQTAAGLMAQPPTDRSPLDGTRDVLTSALRVCIGALASGVDPECGEAAVFSDPTERRDRSERLRTELTVYRELCRRAALALAGPDAPKGAAASELLRRYAEEFSEVGYKLLRDADREPFDRFLDVLTSLGSLGGAGARKLREDCSRFSVLVDRVVQLVGRRAEIAGQEPDLDRARHALDAFLERIAESAQAPTDASLPPSAT